MEHKRRHLIKVEIINDLTTQEITDFVNKILSENLSKLGIGKAEVLDITEDIK